VTAVDWEPNSASLERATIMRVRGWLSFSRSPIATVEVPIFLAMYVTDEDTGTSDPELAAFYSDEDVLWTYGIQFPVGNASAVEIGYSHNVVVDVKAMRRITNGQELRLTFVASTSATITMSGVLRTLVRKSN